MRPAEDLARLARVGFEAVGYSIPVTVDDGAVIVRHLIVEPGDPIRCLRVGGDGNAVEVFSMPSDAMEAAASALVIRILSGIVARAIETAGT